MCLTAYPGVASSVPGPVPGGIGQSVTCLAANMCLTADSGVANLILTQSYTGSAVAQW